MCSVQGSSRHTLCTIPLSAYAHLSVYKGSRLIKIGRQLYNSKAFEYNFKNIRK